ADGVVADAHLYALLCLGDEGIAEHQARAVALYPVHLEQDFAPRAADGFEHRRISLASVAQQADPVRVDLEESPFFSMGDGFFDAKLFHASHGSVGLRCAPLPSTLRPTAARSHFGTVPPAWLANEAVTPIVMPRAFSVSWIRLLQPPGGKRARS